MPAAADELAVMLATAGSLTTPFMAMNLLMVDRPLTAVWKVDSAPLRVPSADSLDWKVVTFLSSMSTGLRSRDINCETMLSTGRFEPRPAEESPTIASYVKLEYTLLTTGTNFTLKGELPANSVRALFNSNTFGGRCKCGLYRAARELRGREQPRRPRADWRNALRFSVLRWRQQVFRFTKRYSPADESDRAVSC